MKQQSLETPEEGWRGKTPAWQNQLTVLFIFRAWFGFFCSLLEDFVSPNTYVHCEDTKVLGTVV